MSLISTAWHPPLALGFEQYRGSMSDSNHAPFQMEIESYHAVHDDGGIVCMMCDGRGEVTPYHSFSSGDGRFYITIPPGEYSVVAQCCGCGHRAEIYSG